MSQALDAPAREFDDRRRGGRPAPAPTAGVRPAELVLIDHTADNTIRWAPGERFHNVFEQIVDDLVVRGLGDAPAVDLDGETISFVELDRLASALARRLAGGGIGAGSRLGLLFDRSAQPYIAMLAVSKLHAAWVPLDPAFPADRISYICTDAGIDAILTEPHLTGALAGVEVRIEVADGREPPADRLTAEEAGDPVDDLAYIIYTSGTTGRPKGVAIEHAAICNFVRVAAEHYGYRPGDRVYQGLTIAFDFSFEEIWVPLVAGATLVPAPPAAALVGAELAEFLLERHITALCCVPTLLATLDDDVPDLRLVLVSGEACPEDLVRRWHAPHRRFLNLYGPTETTVTATWTPLVPDEPVTIGMPLPTYSIVVVDPQTLEPLPFGAEGILAVAGIGLSPGYIGRDDLTATAFVPDPLGLPGNPSGRLYLTGDLGRVNADGRIEYRGRVDTQVKVRGYRIELVEIESALMEHPDIAQAAVTTHTSEAGEKELAAFYTVRTGRDVVDHDDVMRGLRELLPPFMVPSYLERLDRLPVQTSGKVERRALPAPSGPRYVAGGEFVEPKGELESALAEAMAGALGLSRVSAEAHFFTDLGADSLRLAGFCATLRADPRIPAVTTKDVYLNPSIRRLAAAISGMSEAPDIPLPATRVPHVASRRAHLTCGAAQALAFLLYLSLPGVVLYLVFEAMQTDDWVQANLSAVLITMAGMGGMAALPLVLKWTLIGRYDTEPIPVWSARYFRFWVVRAALRFSPALLLAGSPAYNVYLRALGVRVGRHALVLSRTPPVCSDLVTIGAGAVIHGGVHFDGYRAESGWLVPGRVHIGADTVLGDSALVDIDTRIGDGASLAHASALLEGQEIPPGRRWHGSPAVDAGEWVAEVSGVQVSTAYRAFYGFWQAVSAVFLGSQIGVAVFALALLLDVRNPVRALLLTVVMLFVGALVIVVLPRVAAIPLRPGRVYPVYGIRWILYVLVATTSNSRFFNELFGDSSAILHYMRAIGIRMPNPLQTGSNFGMAQSQQVPTMCTIGRGTMASDDFAMPNADFSSQGFRVREIRVGTDVFMGNGVIFPPGATVGDDCLLATKVMVPVDGPVRSGVGLLGSPAFEIPRTVLRDTRFDHLREGEAFRRGLAAKNRHNLVTALLYLATRFLGAVIGMTALFTAVRLGPFAVVVASLAALAIGFALLFLIDAATRFFRPLEPLYCSLYDLRFWRHERYWKLNDPLPIAMFDGTPFKPLAWRLFGVRVGRMLFDDGCFLPERSMVTLGDSVTLSAGSVLHGHSLEDGTFKSGRITLGAGVSVGPGAVVHYGTEIGNGVVVAPDSFVMKGETAERDTLWRGNPAVLSGTIGVRGERPEQRATGVRPGFPPIPVPDARGR